MSVYGHVFATARAGNGEIHYEDADQVQMEPNGVSARRDGGDRRCGVLVGGLRERAATEGTACSLEGGGGERLHRGQHRIRACRAPRRAREVERGRARNGRQGLRTCAPSRGRGRGGCAARTDQGRLSQGGKGRRGGAGSESRVARRARACQSTPWPVSSRHSSGITGRDVPCETALFFRSSSLPEQHWWGAAPRRKTHCWMRPARISVRRRVIRR